MLDLSDRCLRCNSSNLEEVTVNSYEPHGERFTDEGYCCRQCGECFRFEAAVQPAEDTLDDYNAGFYADLKKHLEQLQEFNNIRNGPGPEDE